jgi:hypothetical protein
MARADNNAETDRVAGTPLDGERRAGLRAAGGIAARVAGPIVSRRRGGLLARLKADWRAIADDAVAAQTWPEAISRDGGLRLRVVPRAALELQHRAPQLIERVNLFFGRRVVARIVLVQGPLPLAAPSTAVAAPPDSQNPAADAVLTAQLADIGDPALRTALAGLGRLVRGRGEA